MNILYDTSFLVALHNTKDSNHFRAKSLLEDLLKTTPALAPLITDCSSYVVMEELGITHAAAFDDHFRQFGFIILP